MHTTLHATYKDVWWEDDDGNPIEEPFEEGGYTDPHNPWGGFTVEVPPGLCGEPFVAWRDENAAAATVHLWEAAEMVLDFPGRTWDYDDAGDSELQLNGHWRQVTLHVEEHATTVFALADTIKALRAKGVSV